MYTHPNAVRYHEHPIKILRYSAKNVWLLIFPLLRSLRFYPFSIQNLIDWGKDAWFDLLIAALIICFSTFRWYCCSYFFDEDSIYAQSGIFLKQEIEIPFSKIMASVEEHPLYLRSFHAVRLKISTVSGNLPESNMSLILYDHDLRRLRPHIAILYGNDGETTAYRTPAWRVFLFSALFSSSSSSAIYVAILFFQGEQVVLELLEEFQARELLEDATERASAIFVGVPRIGLTVGIVILVLWLLSFFRNMLRYANFRICFGGSFYSIHIGLLNRRHFHLRETAIVFLDLRQNLIMKLFGMVSLHIRCPGYGSRQDTLPVLIPLVSKRSSWEILEKFHVSPKLEAPIVQAKSKLRFFWSFVWLPVISILVAFVVQMIATWLFPAFRVEIHFFGFMYLLPLSWFLLVRVVSIFHQSIAMDQEKVQMHFSRGFIFHTITVSRENIVRMDIRQTPLQKHYGLCRLYLVCNGPRQQRFKLIALSEKQARQMMQELEAATSGC